MYYYIEKYCKHLNVFFLSIILIAVAGCSPKNSDKIVQNTNSAALGQDDQYYFDKENATLFAMAESTDGYYFFSGVNCYYLYFLDKKTMKAQILCNKPDCLHANEPNQERIANCNAFYNTTTSNMIYYNGNLYLLDAFGGGLYQVSPDGTQRKKVYTFTNTLTSMIIHRGYIYFSTSDIVISSATEIEEKSKSEFYRLDLSNLGKKPELLYQIYGYDAYISHLVGYKDTVYFSYISFNDKTLLEFTCALMEYTNGEIVEIKRDAEKYSICGKYFVFCRSGKIYRCNMDGTDTICLDKVVGIPFSCESYIITDTFLDKQRKIVPKRQLIVYDLNGVELASADIDTIKSGNRIYGVAGNMVFIPDNYTQKNEFGYINSLWTFDLNDVKTGTLIPKKVFEFVPKVEDKGVSTSR